MKKFLIIYKENGIGCDYTIGCGTKYEIKEFKTIEEAKEAVIYPDGREEYPILKNYDLERLIIIPMENYIDIDIKKEMEEIIEIERKEKEEEDLIEKRKEYEKLKKFFNE